MKNEPERDEVVAEENQPKKSQIPILILVLSLIVVGMLAYIAYLKIIPLMSKGTESEPKAESEQKEPELVEVYQFERLTTNPSGSAGRRFAVVSLAGEYNASIKEEFLEEIESKKPQIQHILIEILSSKTVEELETQKKELQQEVLDKLNETLLAGKLRGIYFTEFVIQ